MGVSKEPVSFGTSGIIFGLGLVTAWVASAGAPAWAGDPVPPGRVVTISGTVLARREAKEGAPTSAPRKLSPGDSVLEGDILNTGSQGSVKLLMSDRSILDLGPSSLFKVSEFKVSKQVGDRAVGIDMDYGKIRVSVNQPLSAKGKFKIKTKAATMGVRGTEFIVAADLDTSSRGRVSSGAGADGGAATAASAAAASASGSGGSLSGGTASASGPAPAAAPQTQITVVQGKVAVASGGSSGAPATNLTPGKQISLASTPSTGSLKVDAPKVVELSPQQMQNVKTQAKVEDKTFIQAVTVEKSGSSSSGSGGGGGSSTIAAYASVVAPKKAEEKTASAKEGKKDEAKKEEGKKEEAKKEDGKKETAKEDAKASEKTAKADEASGTAKSSESASDTQSSAAGSGSETASGADSAADGSADSARGPASDGAPTGTTDLGSSGGSDPLLDFGAGAEAPTASGDGTSGGAGATAAAPTVTASDPVAEAPSAADLGVAGTFGADIGSTTGSSASSGAPVTLKIRFLR